MFTLLKHPTFTTTVRIIVPTDNGDVEQTLIARFRRLPEDTINLGVDEFLQQALISLDDVVDEAGNPVICDDTLRDELRMIPFMRIGLIKAYWTALSKAKLGN